MSKGSVWHLRVIGMPKSQHIQKRKGKKKRSWRRCLFKPRAYTKELKKQKNCGATAKAKGGCCYYHIKTQVFKMFRWKNGDKQQQQQQQTLAGLFLLLLFILSHVCVCVCVCSGWTGLLFVPKAPALNNDNKEEKEKEEEEESYLSSANIMSP